MPTETSRTGQMLRRFARNEDGNFAVVAALAFVPILMALGGGVDVVTAMNRGTDLQGALDSTALAVARRPAEMADKASEVAEAYFLANFGSKLPLTLEVTKDKVTVEATLPYRTAFLPIARIDEIPLKRTSEVSLATNTREVALVLDTTGSMAGTKIATMRKAAARLVADLAQAGKDSGQPTRFALVPFAPMVNVGFKSNGQPWDFVDQTGNSNPVMGDIPKGLSRFDLYAHLGRKWGGCVESRPNGFDTTDDASASTKPETMFVPSFAMDEPDGTYAGYFAYPNNYLVDNDGSKRAFALANNWSYNNRTSPTGTIVGDVLKIGAAANGGRFASSDHPLARYGVRFNAQGDISPRSSWTKPTFRATYRYLGGTSVLQGPDAQCVSDPVIPLTTDDAQVSRAIAALTPEGATNIVEGVAWGWRMLSPQAPFTEGRPYDDEKNDKVMVLLTDGSNDLTSTTSIPGNEKGSFYSSYGYAYDGVLKTAANRVPRSAAENKSAMDARVLRICANAKKAGVKIFTILLEENNAATASMLRECASSPSQFYDTTDSSRLEAVFEDIKGKISRLRVSR